MGIDRLLVQKDLRVTDIVVSAERGNASAAFDPEGEITPELWKDMESISANLFDSSFGYRFHITEQLAPLVTLFPNREFHLPIKREELWGFIYEPIEKWIKKNESTNIVEYLANAIRIFPERKQTFQLSDTDFDRIKKAIFDSNTSYSPYTILLELMVSSIVAFPHKRAEILFDPMVADKALESLKDVGNALTEQDWRTHAWMMGAMNFLLLYPQRRGQLYIPTHIYDLMDKELALKRPDVRRNYFNTEYPEVVLARTIMAASDAYISDAGEIKFTLRQPEFTPSAQRVPNVRGF